MHVKIPPRLAYALLAAGLLAALLAPALSGVP